jgi:hypothetical protein
MNKKFILQNNSFFYGILGIENHNVNTNTTHRFLFNAIRNNHLTCGGDIFEFGVYKGHSLISIAILLKKLGSDKKVYGFDTFSGFPSKYSEQDRFMNFEKYNGTHFDEDLVNNAILAKNIKKAISGNDVNISNISTSLNFSDVQLEELEKKIEYLGLDNIELIKGEFKDTVDGFFNDYKGEVFAANVDCDLYDGYVDCLPQLCERLVKNGYIHLDEYYSLKFPGPRLACIDFLSSLDPKTKIALKKNITPKDEFERWYITKN